VFYNESSKYTIAKFKFDQKKDERVTIVGYFEPPKKHELCLFSGTFIDHPRFGRQFQVHYMEKLLPTSKEAIIRFLSSAFFPGVGVKAATNVVDILGEECLIMIQEDSKILDKVHLKPDQKHSIIEGISKSSHLDEAIKLFVGHGIEMKYLIKMDATYGKDMIHIVKQNPYRLINDIDGLHFKVVDKIAASMGIPHNDVRRLAALLVYVANQECFQSQDTYVSASTLFNACLRIQPDLTLDQYDVAFSHCVAQRDLIVDNHMIFPAPLFLAETGIANYLHRYLKLQDPLFEERVIREEVIRIEGQLGIQYSQEQLDAILLCLQRGVSIITGGPGTGKTTIVNAIIQIYKKLYPRDIITVCAPTGRAAKRLTDITQEQATTIHRILKWDLDTNRYGIDETNALEGDFLIVDEFSMVDCQLFYHLLAGTHPYRKILLIGDDQQLPPVSPGDVLRDLLESKLIPVIKLMTIFRQKGNSGIIPLCYDVRQGKINRANLEKDDVTFHQIPTQNIQESILREIQLAMERGFDQQDIQILAPMYDGNAGITNLNYFIRDYLNPPVVNRKEVKSGSRIFRENDKVIQLKNQPIDDVYNGDIGVIVSITIDDLDKNNYVILVDFDGISVSYRAGDMYKLDHAYCISVHKSQGSEYRYVIMPIVKEHRIMLRRKLIYTGISRTKEELVLLGSLEALERGVERIEQKVRKTTLKQRLQIAIQEEEFHA
jgi:exodeoxyribonuclease V alpha subunit